MLLAINIIGIIVFIGITYLLSNDRKNISWKSVGAILLVQLILAWFFLKFSWGRDVIMAVSDFFNWLLKAAYAGIAFAVPDWVTPAAGGSMNFVTGVVLPILVIIPLFDVLMYVGIMPAIIKFIGKGLSKVTGQPKFESFFSIEMMFLGTTEVLPVVQLQLRQMSARRNLTVAMMSISAVSASILGSYVKMMPGAYVLTAIPLNILSAVAMSIILNPTKIDPAEDIVADISVNPATGEKQKREPFFGYLGASILGAGKVALIIIASVIGFVGLATLVDNTFALTGFKWLSLENIFGVIMFPFAWLLGNDVTHAFHMAQLMGTKLVTNEFVVMGQVSKAALAGTGLFADKHFLAGLTVFTTSFANFGTLGMVIGEYRSMTSQDTADYVAKHVPLILISGILVSLLSAAMAGLFVW